MKRGNPTRFDARQRFTEVLLKKHPKAAQSGTQIKNKKEGL